MTFRLYITTATVFAISSVRRPPQTGHFTVNSIFDVNLTEPDGSSDNTNGLVVIRSSATILNTNQRSLLAPIGQTSHCAQHVPAGSF